jgi:hypothetical protein
MPAAPAGMASLPPTVLEAIAFDRPRVAPWTEECREFHVLVEVKRTRRGSYGFVVRRYDRDGKSALGEDIRAGERRRNSPLPSAT